MAKFCGNCGAQMEDNAKVCGNCGTPFGAATQVTGVHIVDLEKKKKLKRKIKKISMICVSVVCLILAIVIAINVITSFSGYNGLLRKVLAAYEDYNVDALISMSSDIYYYGSEDFAEIYFENAVGYGLDYFESAVGHSYKLSYEIGETYTLSNRNFQSLLDNISRMYAEFDTSIIDKVAVAQITVTAKQGNHSADRELKVTMSKEAGTWKVLYIE